VIEIAPLLVVQSNWACAVWANASAAAQENNAGGNIFMVTAFTAFASRILDALSIIAHQWHVAQTPDSRALALAPALALDPGAREWFTAGSLDGANVCDS
jgi:hypothetical protein